MSPQAQADHRRGNALLTLAAVVVIVAGLKAAAPILQPLLLALFLSLISLPLLRWLRRRGVRTSLAITTTVLADLALLAVLGLLLSVAVDSFARAAPSYLEQLLAKARAGLALLEERDYPISEWIAVEPIAPEQLVEVLGGLLGGTVKGVASLVSYVTLVAVGLIFTLYELLVLPDKLGAIPGRSDITHHFAGITRELQRYLGIKTMIGVGTGTILGLWVGLMGVDFALFWGLGAFLLNYIPVLGPLIAGVPVVLLTLVQLGWARALVVGIGYLVVKLVIGDLVEPHLMGRRFGLSTLVVFISLLFWGWVWGPLGMILSVPLTMVIKIILHHTEHYQWVATLLGPSPAAKPPPVES